MSDISSPRPAVEAGLTILYHHRTRARDGQSVHIDEMINALRAEGHRVIVVEPERVDAMASTFERRALPRFAYELAELAYSFVEFVKLARATIRHRPDGFYQRANLFMLSGVWLSRVFRLPYLLEVNAPLAAERKAFGGLSWPRLGTWTEKAMWRSASMVLPVTGVLARFITRAGVQESRIRVIPNGVDIEKFSPSDLESAKKALNIPSPLVLGFVGYVREWHGLEHIIDVLASEEALQNAHLLIIGDGPAREPLERRARDAGISERVTITGVVAREDLPRYISAFDVALQPEVTEYASPLKLFEYMAMRRAIVAPATENIREVLEHGVNSLLFQKGDMAALCAAIVTLAADPELRNRLGAGAAARIRERDMTWRGNARRVAALFANLHAEPVCRPA